MYVKVVEKQIQLLTFTISKVSVTQSVNHPKKCFFIFFSIAVVSVQTSWGTHLEFCTCPKLIDMHTYLFMYDVCMFLSTYLIPFPIFVELSASFVFGLFFWQIFYYYLTNSIEMCSTSQTIYKNFRCLYVIFEI